MVSLNNAGKQVNRGKNGQTSLLLEVYPSKAGEARLPFLLFAWVVFPYNLVSEESISRVIKKLKTDTLLAKPL